MRPHGRGGLGRLSAGDGVNDGAVLGLRGPNPFGILLVGHAACQLHELADRRHGGLDGGDKKRVVRGPGDGQVELDILVRARLTPFHRCDQRVERGGWRQAHPGRAIQEKWPVADGQITKVANQIIVALNIAAIAEALLFASKAGADPAKVRQALMGGFASSRVLEVHGKRMITRTFNQGFRIRLHQKDLNRVLQGVRAIGVALERLGNHPVAEA